MKNLNNYISERLHITKDTKPTPERFIDTALDLPENRIEFPVEVSIAHKFVEKIIGYDFVGNTYRFYNDKQEIVFVTSQKTLLTLFDDNLVIVLNTKFGFKPVKLLK